MRRLTLFTVIGLAAAAAPPAFAQTPAGPGTVVPISRWSVEAYGGISFGQWTRGGEQSLPGAGSPIATSSPVFPSWSVPTWFLGDGAAFLNDVASGFGLSNRITPLDPALTPNGGGAGQFMAGVRLTRVLQPPWSVEVGLEFATRPDSLSDDLMARFNDTAATFQSTFRELLATGPFTGAIVNSGLTAATGTSADATVTVALRTRMAPIRGFETYAVAGGGLVLPLGDGTTAGIQGRYRFQIAGTVPIDEADAVTIRYKGRTTFVAVFGGGVERAIGSRVGVRLDARVLAGPATTQVVVSSAPVTASGTPAGFIESFTYPNLQFSNNISTGRRSTLGAPGLDGVSVFRGGWSVRGRATVGVFVRF